MVVSSCGWLHKKAWRGKCIRVARFIYSTNTHCWILQIFGSLWESFRTTSWPSTNTMVTYDYGVMGDFDQTPPEPNQIGAEMIRYIGECRKILELDYGLTQIRTMCMMTTTMLLNMSTKLQLRLHGDWNGLSILANLISLGKISQKIPKTVLTLNIVMFITNAIANDF